MHACSAKAAPTTRRRIALRLVDSSEGDAEDDEDPGDAEQLLIHVMQPLPKGYALPDHALRSGCGGFVQQFQRFLRRRGDEQLLAALRRTGSRLSSHGR